MSRVNALFVTQFVPHFPNLRKLELCGQNSPQKLDLFLLSSSLPLLSDLTFLGSYSLENTESLENLVHLSSLHFKWCHVPDLKFLSEENSFPELTTLRIEQCGGLSTSSSSFASLAHAPNLHVLQLNPSTFDNECLQYLENMVHLRKLDLSSSNIVGDSRSLDTLMQNLFQLEELNLSGCCLGHQGAIDGALFSTRRRLRVLDLSYCELTDVELDGISKLKNTLEELDLSYNRELTNETLVNCKDLVKLKILKFAGCCINELSPLKDSLNLEELDVSNCAGLSDGSFRVFSEEPNSFPNLRVLALKDCPELTENVFADLSKNKNLVYQLTELNIERRPQIEATSETARNNLCQLKRLRILRGITLHFHCEASCDLIRNLKNLETLE